MAAKKFHLTSLAVLVIHFIALLPNVCHSLDILGEKCDIFTGSWVHDSSYPLYDVTKCHTIPGQFNCQKNGRPDSDYQKWRWKPLDCNLNRFNALDFLQRLRGKKILFAGDSLTNDQWQSMVCLLSSVSPPGRSTLSTGQGISTFEATDYGVSVSFQWAPFLVDRVNKTIGGQQKVVIELDSVELNAKEWVGQDILLFESGHWWGQNVGDPRSASDWKNPTGHNCENETEPILGSSYPGPYPPQLGIAEDVLHHMSSPVSFLNITTLTLLRKDGHPSIYTDDHSIPGRADCLHWCLPGVPDAWNELLYSSLFF
eukprot:PITA_07448